MKLLLTCSIQGQANRAMFMDPCTFFDLQLLLLSGEFNGFLGDAMCLPESGQWCECRREWLAGLGLAFTTSWARKPGRGGGGGGRGGSGGGRGSNPRLGGRGGLVFW